MSYRILIVDDSPAIHGIVRRILALSGFDAADCVSALNGAEALESLRRHPGLRLELTRVLGGVHA